MMGRRVRLLLINRWCGSGTRIKIVRDRRFDQLGTRIGSIEVEIEEFSERHVATYQIAYRRRPGRFCTAFRYVRSGSRDVGTSAFPVTMASAEALLLLKVQDGHKMIIVVMIALQRL
ncbi:hypothetical protein E3N88_07612 [Mikania micrantha]|uniref:Uncharacterized protein n=1 Tax=Mikania micrantha TaxID=192012 RepID=A0A5N6PTE7_9ASTR|nr:hypothetical protein E3N88_07612 [Mikania micrantha]